MSTISNVKWVVRKWRGGPTPTESVYVVADTLRKESLIHALKSGLISAPTCPPGGVVYIEFIEQSRVKVKIEIANLVGEVDRLRFTYPADSKIVLESIRSGENLVNGYRDASFYAECCGNKLTQEQYIRTL